MAEVFQQMKCDEGREHFHRNILSVDNHREFTPKVNLLSNGRESVTITSGRTYQHGTRTSLQSQTTK